MIAWSRTREQKEKKRIHTTTHRRQRVEYIEAFYLVVWNVHQVLAFDKRGKNRPPNFNSNHIIIIEHSAYIRHLFHYGFCRYQICVYGFIIIGFGLKHGTRFSSLLFCIKSHQFFCVCFFLHSTFCWIASMRLVTWLMFVFLLSRPSLSLFLSFSFDLY